MRDRHGRVGCVAVMLLAALAGVADAGIWFPTFPGAEGFGARTIGGRGGAVIEVTNLNDSGPGSLRAAIDASGPRTVVFRVGGTITLQSTLLITHPYITIAGQTAPGGGIALRNAVGFNKYEDPSGTIDIRTHDVVLRHLRIRSGLGLPGTTGNEGDAIQIYGPAHNIMIDHCSLSWTVDENFSSWNNTTDWTMQWCIVSEALLNAGHSEGPHSMGVLVGSEGSTRISLHHNLLAHNKDRNPRIKTSGIVDYVNNVSYNFGEFNGLLSSDYAVAPFNYVGNYVRIGPNSETSYELQMWELSGKNCQAYVYGNIGPHRADDNGPQITVVDPSDRQYVVTTRFDAQPVITETAALAYARILNEAGATLPARDPVDTRVVNDVINITGQIIDDPAQGGGWPTLAAGTAPVDEDHDGMADAWETQYGLNPANPADGAEDLDGDGYTNLEEYLNATDPKVDPLCGVKLTAYAGTSPHGATLSRALAGRPYRTDKAFFLNNLPAAYDGAVLVRYAEADSTDGSANFMSLSLARAATVAVAYDARATTVPSWLSGWTSTGQSLSVRERGDSEALVNFTLRTKAFGAGQTVTLEGNRSGGGNGPSGYIVLVLPDCPLPAPQFQPQPASQVVNRGQTVVFSATVKGEGPIRYQWRKNGVALTESAKYSGTLTPTLTISNAEFADAGSYQLVATDFWGTGTSATATLTLNTPCDYDGDGDVDQEDFGHLQGCLGAPPSDPACQDAQLNSEPGFTGSDVIVFLGCMSGPGNPAAPRCRGPQ